jgi:hypothetical protein
MSYKKISHYMIFAFLGGLGLFNSTQLESRYATDTNQELIFQNGQIISSAIIILCVAGILAEFAILRKQKKDEIRTRRRAGKSTTIVNQEIPRWMSKKKNGNFILNGDKKSSVMNSENSENPSENPSEIDSVDSENSEIELGVSVDSED